MTSGRTILVDSRQGVSARGLGNRRYLEVMRLVDQHADISPPVQIALRLVLDIAVLNAYDLKSATGRSAAVYADGDVVYIEWPRQFDFTDRRVLSNALARAIWQNSGPLLKATDWSAAFEVLRIEYVDVESHQVWKAFLGDARQWWGDYLTPPLQAHAECTAPFEVLPIEALARRARGQSHGN